MKGALPPCALVFAKAPIPGQVKTRLARAVGEQRAAELAQAFLEDTLEVLRAEPRVEVAIAFDPPQSRAWFEARASAALLLPQVQGDLGARMEAASSSLFARGHRGVLALGADAPHMLAAVLEPALQALAEGLGAIACADDGGYHLLALNAPAPWLREGIPWSSGSERAATVRRAREAGVELRELPSGFDLDHPADLERLRGLLHAHPELHCPATRRILA